MALEGMLRGPGSTDSDKKSARLFPVWGARSASSHTKPCQDSPPGTPVLLHQLGLAHSWVTSTTSLFARPPPQPQPSGAPSPALQPLLTSRYRYTHPHLHLADLSAQGVLVLVSNHSPGCDGGNTALLAGQQWTTETSLWVGVLCNIKYLLKRTFIEFFLSQSCPSHLPSSLCLRADLCTCFSLFAPSWHTGTASPLTGPLKMETSSPRHHFSVLPVKICINLLCFSSENQKWAVFQAYNKHTQKCELLQVPKSEWAFSLPFPYACLVSQVFIKLSLRKGNTRNELYCCNLDCLRDVNIKQQRLNWAAEWWKGPNAEASRSTSPVPIHLDTLLWTSQAIIPFQITWIRYVTP